MATITQAVLYDAVASRLGVIREELIPVNEDIDAWALDCLRWLLPLAPSYAVSSILTAASAQAEPWAIPATCLKVVQVRHATDNDILTYVPPSEFPAISVHIESTDYYISNPMTGGLKGGYYKGSRVWTDAEGQVTAHNIGSSDTLDILYITAPVAGIYPLSIPNGWEGLLATYCAIQLKMKWDQDVSQLQAAFKNELSRFQGFTNVPETVGG